MSELLDKISSYNLFNYLLPGVLFAVISSKLTHYNFLGYEVVVAAFLYYFIGLVVSRFGSLIIEPVFKWTNFVKFAKYADFVTASNKDPKIDILSEANNMFRTLCSLFLVLALLKLYEKLGTCWPLFEHYRVIALIVLLFVMFAFAYRKQTRYITQRVQAELDKK